MKQTMSPIMKTTMFATEMEDPVMLFDIPGNPSTTASAMTSTITTTTRRMNEGMTGVNAPQVLFEVESVILFTLGKTIAIGTGYCPVETLVRLAELQIVRDSQPLSA